LLLGLRRPGQVAGVARRANDLGSCLSMFLICHLLSAQMLVTRGREGGTYEKKHQSRSESEPRSNAGQIPGEGLFEAIH